MTDRIIAVVVDISVDRVRHQRDVEQRRISCSGTESIDEFQERVRKTMDQMLDRPHDPMVWRIFAQQILTSYQRFASNADGCIAPDIEQKARDLGLDTEAWLDKRPRYELTGQPMTEPIESKDCPPTREQLEQALRDAYRDPMCVSGHVPDCDCGSPPLLRRPT